MNYRGAFFVFEGPDSSGKTTQYQRAINYFKTVFETLGFREPGGTKIGEQIREILLNLENKEMSTMTELLLFNASRAQLIDQEIRPALERGNLVFVDRFSYSSQIYQGIAGGLDARQIELANDLATRDISPIKVYVLDVSPEIAAQRMQGRKRDRFEEKSPDFHRKIREGYLSLARQDPKAVVIDTTNINPDQVEAILKKDIEKCIKERGLEDKLLKKSS